MYDIAIGKRVNIKGSSHFVDNDGLIIDYFTGTHGRTIKVLFDCTEEQECIVRWIDTSDPILTITVLGI